MVKRIATRSTSSPITHCKQTNDRRLHNVLFSNAVARLWPDVTSNAMSPGWVATKMGGNSAPDSMKKAIDLVSWLSTKEKEATGTGKYFAANSQRSPHKAAEDKGKQDEFLRICEEMSGVAFPKS